MNKTAHKTVLPNHSHSFPPPFSFNGKEKDSESGFHYYGARYYWSETLTGWLSVDPMADKYPGVSPYSYCVWNPVKLVDPKGMESIENDDWYRNKSGDIIWDESVKSQDDLPEGCTYLGERGIGVNEQGDITRVYNDDGTIDDIPQSLPQIDISAKRNRKSTEIAARIPFALSVALYDGPEPGPADVVAILSTFGLSIYALGNYMLEEINTPDIDNNYYNESRELGRASDEGHHTRKSPSTWNTHTKKRPGNIYGQNRNNSRGDKNKKHKPSPNPNKKQ